MAVNPEDIREKIREGVIDPEIGLNIVDIGLIYDVEVEENIAEIDMTLTSPGCPLGPQIIREVKVAVTSNFPELEAVNVNIVWQPFWSPEMMSDWAKDELGIF
ncbi:MAG: metal-sulfur cluster assembly factor [Chloroflexota bacterium]|nr:metal-sulfur cluster assembly factor [Chloroflexota bacterium]